LKDFDIKDLAKLVENEYDEYLKKMGIVNILIAGKSGVGKSTLINAIFQGDFATTGQGSPITKETRKLTKKGIPVSLFDTQGLELEQYQETLSHLLGFIEDSRRKSDENDHIHAAWVCVSEDSARWEAGEIALVKLLSENKIPVIVIITKARQDKGLLNEIRKLSPEASQYVRIRALAEILDDGHQLKPMGLIELIQVTHEVVPEGRKNAFSAAQKVDIELKKSNANKVIATACTAAGAAGASPIPFSDAAIIAPIQVSMIVGITVSMGLTYDQSALTSIATAAVGCTTATLLGRTIAVNLLKLIPGGGTLVGGAISATTAIALTGALGKLYLELLIKLIERHGREPSVDEIVEGFKDAWANRN
jgi:uncharacterized protein (DUF697 family)